MIICSLWHGSVSSSSCPEFVVSDSNEAESWCGGIEATPEQLHGHHWMLCLHVCNRKVSCKTSCSWIPRYHAVIINQIWWLIEFPKQVPLWWLIAPQITTNLRRAALEMPMRFQHVYSVFYVLPQGALLDDLCSFVNYNLGSFSISITLPA